MTPRARRLIVVLLGVVVGIATVKLTGRARAVASLDLQADFSAYYTAGQSLNAGLSPYRNHADRDSALWDGVCLWRQSRFFYPPLAALPFQALAALPYQQAKAIWTGLILALALTALLLSARLAGSKDPLALLLAGLWLVAGWPLLLQVERGQIDLLTLNLILVALLAQRQRSPIRTTLAAVLWALAILFKLNVVLALPFLALRRRFDILAGALGVLLLLAGVSYASMPQSTGEFARQVMPGLFRHGIHALAQQVMPDQTLASLLQGYPPALAHVHGRDYVRFGLVFDEHASLVWAMAGERPRIPGALSLLTMVAFVVLGAGALRRRAGAGTSHADDLGWWMLALSSVLLAAPLTWSMNTVWLLPAVFVVVAHRRLRPTTSLGWATWVTGTLGLVLVALPDRFAWPWPAGLHWLSAHKYVIGELAVALAMVCWQATASRGEAPPTQRPAAEPP